MKKRLTDKDKQLLAINMIAEACKILGWGIAVPKTKSIEYLVIGEGKLINKAANIFSKIISAKAKP